MTAKVISVIGEATEPDERFRLEWGLSLEEHMSAQDVSIKELVRRLAELDVTVTRQAVESWISGKTAPRPYHQAAIGTCLNVPARRLFPIENLPRKVAS